MKPNNHAVLWYIIYQQQKLNAMNWYIAKLVYRVICGNGLHTPQFNEQLRLVAAEDPLHAFYKARLIGERETTACTNNTIPVQWKFIDVTEIFPVNKMTDGAELWSCMNEDKDAEAYIRNTQQKSNSLLQEGILEFDTVNI
jgi:Domain of unknown function (DUF4288)